MRSHRLLRLDDNRSAASCQQAWCNLIIETLCSQAWCKLFQQLAASLQISSCNKSDFHRLTATWWNWQACCKLLTNLQQAGKIHNLQQVCGVSGCVSVLREGNPSTRRKTLIWDTITRLGFSGDNHNTLTAYATCAPQGQKYKVKVLMTTTFELIQFFNETTNSTSVGTWLYVNCCLNIHGYVLGLIQLTICKLCN